MSALFFMSAFAGKADIRISMPNCVAQTSDDVGKHGNHVRRQGSLDSLLPGLSKSLAHLFVEFRLRTCGSASVAV